MDSRTDASAIMMPIPAPRGRIFWRYVIVFGALVTTVLLTASLIQASFAYQENKRALVDLQREKAVGAAARIEAFVAGIEQQLRLMHQIHAASLSERRTDVHILLRQVPAISELRLLDAAGREQLRVSRLEVDVVGSRRDYSGDPGFTGARPGRPYFGPVYFRRQSEPHMAIALAPADPDQGIAVADVNLKLIYDVVTTLRIGKAGLVYVVDPDGALIAHPDLTLVLKKTSMTGLGQVRAALEPTGGGSSSGSAIAYDLSGRRVLTASVPIPLLGWTVFAEQPLAEAFEPLYAFIGLAGALLLVGLLLSVAASTVLATRMVRPIQRLHHGASRVAAGDLTHRVRVKTGDEIEALAEEFNVMTAAVRHHMQEVQRISRLKRYLSPQIAETIMQEDEATLFQSHRREITAVFVDMRGFTMFSEEAEPEDVIKLLRTYHAEMGRLIFEFGGTLEHFAGDGIMIFFNDPLPMEDHTERAVRMAVQMREKALELRIGWLKTGFDLHVGVGIAVGYATLGTIGFEGRMDYGAVGSVTNLAARLSSAAAGGQILIEQKGYSRVAQLVEVEPVEPQRLKGFFRPVTAYNVIQLREVPSSAHTATLRNGS